ncbi:MAG: DNA gyrase subunit A [Epsilonproteobacteria bacterium]|nr:DNA gyrase subunit A [Campylobacterota bacterium]
MDNLFQPQDIRDIKIEDSVKASYLDYSMSVIIGRALPDSRDGLKPVHRRILYAMNELNLSSRAPYKKSARIVGDVIGKYHPHGDSSVYDALVRMAQDFSMRTPLVDGQGNFGSVDGDSAAAMRYTEARMTKISEDILRDIDKDTVNFIPTYDDAGREPSVLPTRIPSLLINGSEGIAVGMATKIPPHNPTEVMNALLHMVENPKATAEDLMAFIQGPDFPTGGTIFGRRGIVDAYTTGRGRVRVRAKHHIEIKNKKDIIVIDELPYQVNKARLVEQIATLAKDKMLEGVSEVRDESDRDGMRVVIELKKEAMAEIVLNNLYKTTPMQITFGTILLAVHNKEPKVFTLPELLTVFLNHRKTVIIRRTIFDLEKAKARAHILEGLKIALDNIDEVVRIIRASANDQEARESLMATFGLSQIQSQAILDMRLGRLTGLQREKLEAELKELLALIEELESILKSEEKLNIIIKEELIETKEKYNDARRTEIEDSYDDIDIEDLIPNEPMVVTITHNGYVKRVSIKAYEMQRRGGKGKIAVTTHDDDFIERFFVSNTHDTLMFVTNMGQLYWLKVYKIPEGSRTAKGKAVVNLINLREDEKIMAIIPTSDFDDTKSLAFFTKQGIVKRTGLSEFSNIRSNGVRAIVLDDEDEVITAQITLPESKYLMIFTALGQVIRFETEKTRTQGRTTRGVRGIKFKDENDYVVDAEVVENEEQELLTVSENGVGKRTTVEEYRITNRAGSGVISMKLSSKTGKTVVGNVIVDENQDLMALTSVGKMIRVDMQTIRKAGRNTSGVNIVDVEKGDRVVSIAKCPKEKEDELDIEDAQDIVSDVDTSETIAPTESQEVNLLNINGVDEE